MSATTLRPRPPHATRRRRVVRASLPIGMADELQRYAVARGWSIEEAATLVLTDFALKQRQQRSLQDRRAAVLRALEQEGCWFSGPVEQQHRQLAHELERLDAGLAS